MRQRVKELAKELHLPQPVQETLLVMGETLPWVELAPLIEKLADPVSAQETQHTLAERLAVFEGESGMAQLAVMLAAANHTRERYAKNGVADSVFLNTMGGFTRFLEETKRHTGQWRFDRAFWTWRQTAGVLFRLGTLEFEYCLKGEGESPENIAPEDPVLSVHIPSDGVLSPKALEESYTCMRRFFAEEGRAFCFCGAPEAVICGSWLLSPTLQTLLTEDSGIRNFAKDYTLYARDLDSTGFYQWLFEGKTGLAELPEDTSLQRKVKQHLAAGGKIGEGHGFLEM